MKNILNKQHLLLDIETNGLSREKHHIVCIGVTYLNMQNEVTTKQWSLQKLEEEENLLKAFIMFAQDFKFIYTYSGKSFDWPFLLARLAHYNLTAPAALTLVDMKKTLSLLSSTRSDLEKHLGFIRATSSSGKALVKLYQTYEACGEEIYKNLILAHNLDELKSLLLFYKVYHMLYHLKRFNMTTAYQTSADATWLDLSFDLPFSFETSFMFKLEDLTLEVAKEIAALNITLPLYHAYLKKALTSVKDYYYIPSQNQLMHKSLATFIPSELKRKATKEECFVEKLDTYFKLYTTFKAPSELWYDDAKNFYYPYTDHETFKALLTQQLFYYFFQN